jgi:hypothetical protein
MKVTVKFIGLAPAHEALRRNEKRGVEFQGQTVRELMDVLIRKFGRNVGKVLLNGRGDFKPQIRILLNGVIYPAETVMRASLRNKDTLVFKAAS